MIGAGRLSDWLLGAAILLRSPKREGGELLAISMHMSGQGISLSFGLHTWCRYLPTYLNCLNKVSYLSGEQDGEMAPPKVRSNRVTELQRLAVILYAPAYVRVFSILYSLLSLGK